MVLELREGMNWKIVANEKYFLQVQLRFIYFSFFRIFTKGGLEVLKINDRKSASKASRQEI